MSHRHIGMRYQLTRHGKTFDATLVADGVLIDNTSEHREWRLVRTLFAKNDPKAGTVEYWQTSDGMKLATRRVPYRAPRRLPTAEQRAQDALTQRVESAVEAYRELPAEQRREQAARDIAELFGE